MPPRFDRLGGFIPAWAGNTVAAAVIVSRAAVHPRVGGEHASITIRVAARSGSSPRGRGTHAIKQEIKLFGRFIPAWAGNTRACASKHSLPPVHPRVGGEHISTTPRISCGSGSSPRGRGTRACRRWPPGRLRFIPAWAGNTQTTRAAAVYSAVHPRVGGEHHVQREVNVPVVGSSPRGRGTRTNIYIDISYLRFIPAWAGNTDSPREPARRESVHPRVGGEHEWVMELDKVCPGSSPRGRGTLHHPFGEQAEVRFIPAWAGNTARNLFWSSGTAVHPRVGGEHPADVGGGSAPLGSSPRGRGTPQQKKLRSAYSRFIPAWAGNTP